MITLYLKGDLNKAKYWMLTLPEAYEYKIEHVMKLSGVAPSKGERCHIVGLKSEINLPYRGGATVNAAELHELDKICSTMHTLKRITGRLIDCWSEEQTTTRKDLSQLARTLTELECLTSDLRDIAGIQHEYWEDLRAADNAVDSSDFDMQQQDAGERNGLNQTVGM